MLVTAFLKDQVRRSLSMSKILRVYDILYGVLRYCDKPTLARLARVSKLISEPALDVLWEELESFTHLLRLLPTDVIAWNHYKASSPVSSHILVDTIWTL